MLPPLSPTPHLSRLLMPGEHIIYTAKLHFLYGWRWLLASVLLVLPWAFSLPYTVYLLPLAAICFAVYIMPFYNWECAITTQRMLVRFGRVGVTFNEITPQHINHVQLHENLLMTILHAGNVTINLQTGHDIRPLHLPYMAHPLTFLEAFETLTAPK